MKICCPQICYILGETNLNIVILNLNVPKGLRIHHIGECALDPVCELNLPTNGHFKSTSTSRFTSPADY